MKSFSYPSILFLLFIITQPLNLTGQVTDPTFDADWAARLQNSLDSVVAAGLVKGTSVAIIMPGHGLFIGTAGESEPGVPITSDMQFGVGSNSKLFTSVLIMKLQELGMLSVDDPISDYLPSFEHINGSITIRQLLSHQSGIFDYETEIDPHQNFFENMDSFVYGPDTFYTPEDVLGMIGPPHFTAGEKYSYSNTNYLLAAMIIEAASGQTFVENIHQYILDPLNLEKTFVAAYEQPTGTLAHGWHLGDDLGGTPTKAPHSMYIGSGSIFSTANDMVHWYQALFDGQIITQASLNEIQFIEPASFYGMGLFTVSWPTFADDDIWTHGGWVPGYTSDMGYDIRRRSPLCVLANDENDRAALVPILIEYYDKPYKVPDDAAIVSILQPHNAGCDSVIAPEVELKNFGTNAITSANIKYHFDNNPLNTYSWTGSLLPDESIIVALPEMQAGPGTHRFYCRTELPNGVAEGYTSYNDDCTSSFIIHSSSQPALLFEGFEGSVFPPEGWLAGDNNTFDWGRSRLSLLSGNGSAIKSFWFDYTGRSYPLEMPLLDLTTLDKPELKFHYAYGYYGHGTDDELSIEISDDCGESYQRIFHKAGNALKTAYAETEFYPDDDQWKLERINLSAYKKKEVLIRFVGTAAVGNNLYIDNVEVREKQTEPANYLQPIHSFVQVYPNPSSDKVNLEFVLEKDEQLTFRITDVFGKVVQVDYLSFREGPNHYEWTCKSFPAGIYMISLTGNHSVLSEKVIVQ